MGRKKSHRKKRELKKSYIILVDGQSEIVYFNLIKSSNIQVLPEIPKRKSLGDMYRLFKDKLTLADRVFWVIDVDVVIKENKISQLKDYVKNYPDNIILNNPCLEYWFYLHYKIGGNFPNRCESVIDALKKQDTFFMNSKSPKYIEQVVKRLSDKIDIACKNAKKRECNLEELKSCSSMYKIIEEFKL
jgi:hypothetical protein